MTLMRPTKRPKQPDPDMRARVRSKNPRVPVDQTRLAFDEDDRIDGMLSDVRDEAQRDSRRATQDKYI